MLKTERRVTHLSNDRSFNRYFHEVSKTAVLSAQDEQELYAGYYRALKITESLFKKKNGSQSTWGSLENNLWDQKERQVYKRHVLDVDGIRSKLINNCLRQVVKMALRYTRNADKVKDLISAGNTGILIAIDRFQPYRKTRFLSYANYWLHLQIREELYGESLVAVPRWRQKVAQRIHNVTDEYAKKNEEAPDEEICRQADLSERQLRNLHKYGNPSFTSLDRTSVPMKIRSYVAPHDDEVINSEINGHLSTYLRTLKPSEQFIVEAYYGVVVDPMSLRQLANVLHVSSERIRQIKETAICKLRTTYRRRLNMVSQFGADEQVSYATFSSRTTHPVSS